LIYLICIISFLQLGIFAMMIFFYNRIKYMMEIESECIRFDILMVKKVVLNKLKPTKVARSLPK
jgi:hypothetical protein